jgi:protein SMG8
MVWSCSLEDVLTCFIYVDLTVLFLSDELIMISNTPVNTKYFISDLSEFVVKIFVGVEYECPRGHRFMCSAPDKVLKTTGSGLVKDNGNKVTSNDMPLYFPCPCR